MDYNYHFIAQLLYFINKSSSIYNIREAKIFVKIDNNYYWIGLLLLYFTIKFFNIYSNNITKDDFKWQR